MNAKRVSQLADPVSRGEGVRTLDFPPYLQRRGEKTVAEFEIRFQYFKREDKLTATIAIQGIPLKLPAKRLIRVTRLFPMTVSGMQHSYRNLPTFQKQRGTKQLSHSTLCVCHKLTNVWLAGCLACIYTDVFLWTDRLKVFRCTVSWKWILRCCTNYLPNSHLSCGWSCIKIWFLISLRSNSALGRTSVEKKKRYTCFHVFTCNTSNPFTHT